MANAASDARGASRRSESADKALASAAARYGSPVVAAYPYTRVAARLQTLANDENIAPDWRSSALLVLARRDSAMARPETVGAGQGGIPIVDARCARSSARCASGASCHGPSVPIVVEDLGHPLPCLRPNLGVPFGTVNDRTRYNLPCQSPGPDPVYNWIPCLGLCRSAVRRTLFSISLRVTKTWHVVRIFECI